MVVLSEFSEGASSSSSTHRHRYDVFLSFRGVDTRHSFTNHLYNALMHANITTFLDDEEIETGEDLKPELESAIKASKASAIVLSKNYATSTWCLDELVLILEQRMKSNHVVIPIFYHVEPTHVRKQQNSFRDAMDKHRERMEAETDANKRSKLAQKMEKWNKALTEVADLKGKDVKDRLEVEFIDEIVKDIFRRLHISSRFPLPQLIGMEDSIKFVNSWLKDASSHTTDILTILGMGGIGKTSLAKYVYAFHSHEFDTSSFIEDINRKCDGKLNGMLDVQKQLYNDISKPSSVQVLDGSIYTTMIEDALARKKVFLVLDDISSIDHLDALLGSKGLHPGTKIIITTRDTWLTTSCALFKIRDMDSTEKLKANNIGINSITSSSTVFKAIPCDFELFSISLPRSLVCLSLAYSNLSTESFPMDFSCLSLLKLLNLDGNPIVSLPNCVRSLPRLKSLSMANCHMLTSVEHPPDTLTYLNLHTHYSDYETALRKVVFDPHMSPLELFINWKITSSFEFEGVKIQPMASVEEKMYYEFGIFSTIYEGKEISFTIPSSSHQYRMPVMKISNITKNLPWIYQHYSETFGVGGECLTLIYLFQSIFFGMENSPA